METEELARKVRELLDSNMVGRGVGLLSTTGNDRRPHSTWMGTLAAPNFGKVITLTSPDSRKARNILENPQVEWLFSNEGKNELLYLSGVARVLDDLDQIETAWCQMSDKSRAYFLPHQKVGMAFLIIETEIHSVEYRLPCEERSYHLDPQIVAAILADSGCHNS